MRRISFFILLSGLFLVIGSILLLVWWPVKATLVDISNSWVAIIMVYIVLVIFLYEKPLYRLYDDFINKQNQLQQYSKQSKQEAILGIISDDDFHELFHYHDSRWENIISAQKNQDVYSDEFLDEISNYFQSINEKRIKWCFLFANNYLSLQAKYILFWFCKFGHVSLDNFHRVWEEKIAEISEREAIIQVLQQLEFIKTDEERLLITHLGIAYTNYLKQLDQQFKTRHEKMNPEPVNFEDKNSDFAEI